MSKLLAKIKSSAEWVLMLGIFLGVLVISGFITTTIIQAFNL